MKKDIQPDYKKATIKCVCGNVIETGSVKEEMKDVIKTTDFFWKIGYNEH